MQNRQRNQRSNCQHPLDHQESKRVPEKHLLLLYWPCQTLWLCESQQTVENSSRGGIPGHLNCLLRNLYADQEATVRTRHGTTDWFQIGKGVYQGDILSSCLFNLNAEYIMRNARLDEAQAGFKRKFSSVTHSCSIFAMPWTVVHQSFLSITNSWSLLKLMSIESVMPFL